MKNSVSDPDFFIHSEEEDDEAFNLEGGRKDGAADEDDDESDDSELSSPRHSSRPSSYNTTWPQSYRQSIDMYSFLGTPTLNGFSNSFITSSFLSKRTPEITTSLTKPLVQEGRKSSHTLLPPPIPTRRPPAKRIQDDHKPHRVSHELAVSQQCSYGQAVLNGMNVLCGVGILSTPYAVKEGGWIGLSILLIFSVLAFYTGILLRCCLDGKPGLETYPDIGQAAFGTTGRFAISVILYLELYAGCVEYIILESDNLSTLFPNAHLDIGGLHLNCHILFAIVATLIVLPTTWLRDLSLLSYISAGGVVASVLVAE
uniref:Amino acid transporter AVT1C n=1 Tax=Elaeis guineensis var. tenera TaxID=51953 RepID=A0A8N4IB09_ELAGV